LNKPIAELVHDVQNQLLKPVDLLRIYGKVAVKAHEKTNCLTEILFPDAESWAENEVNLKGPLAGIPVSLKDTVNVKGFDTSVGYSCHAGKPAIEDGALTKILKRAGKISSFCFISLI
jgi:Asp-tRNA(Asn)/Glu-tRNA(Gln) amidotransferase A subunit family amidase